ncbi:SDR family NAD(P)-dependent oxidoreductase [Methyloraptor flagellatus]|uniref:SDR family NAD(P)-dependent oxidoreductase n=1 Tax=Methyloraptor flagellatus TaxID=3162530 RepID=A0AAU7XAD5_9HYPH
MASSFSRTPKDQHAVAILGAACRLPGAADQNEFWRLLSEGRCAVGPLPEGRWRPERFQHPRLQEPGFSYTFRGGYLAEPLSFDPSVFGISPREAAQIDPQQRLLLEVVWEALENAGIAPSSLAGEQVGVYVGASSLDYGNLHATDPASLESHFMTGNTLSIVSNRISYVYDWHGPSFTVDTACSSSLVAFAEAMAAVESGRVDFAVVAGVNLLLSPASFIGFSRASMLSPTGLCRSFSAEGDGYVRAEGAVAMLIGRADSAKSRGWLPRAMVLASGLNSDGRTSGISLPSAEGQRRLLDTVYGRAGIDPEKLSFVEAHGTGTRVGDPAEATAIGEALGQRRSKPLPIGSVKSNIGHLEPASGLAGMLKSLLAMEHRELPRSLHVEKPNPLIDFDKLNLQLATEPVTLGAELLHCGISSFGFGGTNAHVVMREPTQEERGHGAKLAGKPGEFLILSAQTRDALAETARRYADLVAEDKLGVAEIASAAAHTRDRLSHRLAIPVASSERTIERLRGFAENGDGPGITYGTAPSTPPEIGFVFTGNGCQWPGMGRAAYARNPVFRERCQQIDALFKPLAGWSLIEAMHDPNLAARLKLTAVAQPMLFVVQSAAAAAFADYGLKPSVTLGHSVGEVAAAECAGALSLAEAVRLIYRRSEQQEAVRGLGKMAVANVGEADALAAIAEFGIPDVEVAAVNSPNAVTLSGTVAGIEAFSKASKSKRIAVRVLDLDYPFHSSILAGIEGSMHKALETLAPHDSDIAFVSTVEGKVLDGHELDGRYWWRNIREQVRFKAGIEAAAERGIGLFVEVGARPILLGNIRDTLRTIGSNADCVPSFVEKEEQDAIDPVRATIARALVRGARLDDDRLFGPRPTRRVSLPTYQWQRKSFVMHTTSEALDIYGASPRHPLLGARLVQGTPEWRNLVDPATVPYLADHKVDGEILMPGAGLAEMVLAAAREIFPDGALTLEDFDIMQAMVLQTDSMREVSVRHNDDTDVVEVWSRPRFAGDEWTLHARGRIGVTPSGPRGPEFSSKPMRMKANEAEIYDLALQAGLDYGPHFRLARGMKRNATEMDIALAPASGGTGLYERTHVLHPASLDAAFHPLFHTMTVIEGVKRSYLPVRFARLTVFRDGAEIHHAKLLLERETGHSMTVSIWLMDEADRIVAVLNGGLFREVVLSRANGDDFYFNLEPTLVRRAEGGAALAAAVDASVAAATGQDRPDSWLLLGAFARSLAHRIVLDLMGVGPFAFSELATKDRVSAAMLPLAAALLKVLADAGLAHENDGIWTIERDSGLPDPETILSTFTVETPSASAEIVLASQALATLETALARGEPIQPRAPLIEQFEIDSLLFAPAFEAGRKLAVSLAETAGEPVRVLIAEPNCIGLVFALLAEVRAGRIALTVAGTTRKGLDHVEARVGALAGIDYLEVGADGKPDDRRFDIGLAFAVDPLFGEDEALGRAIAARLEPGARLAVLHPPANDILNVLFGATPGWFARTIDPELPVDRVPLPGESEQRLLHAGFGAIAHHPIGDGTGTVTLASAPAEVAGSAPATGTALIGAAHGDVAEAIDLTLRAARSVPADASRAGADKAAWATALAAVPAGATLDIVDFSALDTTGSERARVERAVGTVAAILEAAAAAGVSPRLWVITSGAVSRPGASIDPVAEAVWCFARVALNEYPAVDLRLVDLAAELSSAEAASRLTALMDAPGAESEVLLDARGLSALRAGRGLSTEGTVETAPAARLELPQKGALSQFVWSGTTRRAPKGNEIEVEVDATGLNFRDVMLAMGLLDDDVLDEGLAGAVFGFECAGRVVSVGNRVKAFKPGDRVMGFAAEAFATHVTADQTVFVPVPEGVDTVAAATIPVAFLTAWYALIELAKLKKGEWVLIHGAAGGVGLAAIQIARMRGARVAATVGSADKRALVKLLGAEKIYNSRNLSFADEIRADIGGVDVVLNSLFGDAMLASIKLVNPFGRFIELGKRDYVANTAMGLRPFRRNITYYGVDVDQLLAGSKSIANRTMRDLGRAFARGDLAPLPYRAFDASEIGAAFRTMQSAAHVGKIVVRPPAEPVPAVDPDRRFRAKAEGVHLVVGGTGGFGFETAAWLADQGAKTIVVASRRGELADAALEKRVTALGRKGVTLAVEKVDATNAADVEALIARVTAQHGPLAGVMHTAMVLDDGFIANLDADRLTAVLAPKIDGIGHLDRATRGHDLQYFVGFSSATTLIGNPGQAAYVAANAYIQGVMRARRAEGLPGLAVAWGAIADAGVLARDVETAKKLERVTGVVGLPVKDALRHLGQILAGPHAPTVYCADIRAGAATRDLKLLQTPTFRDLFQGGDAAEAGGGIDLAAIVHENNEADARRIVGELIAAEVARILRLAAEEIDLFRPLGELGMDSLMALELRMNVEKKFGVELPLVAITSVRNLSDLAAKLIANIKADDKAEGDGASVEATQKGLLATHTEDDSVELQHLAPVAEAIEARRQVTKGLL